MKLSGKQLTAALAVAAATILVPAVALASTSQRAAAEHPAATAPACGNAHPALPGGAFVWATMPGDGFAGGVGYVMEITNRGPPRLLAARRPRCRGSGQRRSPDRQQASGVRRRPVVILKPGATAHFLLTIHIADAVCPHPVNGQVLIYLPGQRQAQNGWQSAQACPGLRGGGVLATGTIQAGTGVPDYSV